MEVAPRAGWFKRENPAKMDDVRIPAILTDRSTISVLYSVIIRPADPRCRYLDELWGFPQLIGCNQNGSDVVKAVTMFIGTASTWVKINGWFIGGWEYLQETNSLDGEIAMV